MLRQSTSSRQGGLARFFSAALFAALIAAPTVHAFTDEAAALAHARQHGRMVRKRGLFDPFGPQDPTTTTTSSVATSTTTSLATSTSSSATSSGDFWDTLTSLVGDPFGTQTSTSTSTSTSSAPTTTSLALNTTTSSFAPNSTTSTTTSSSSTITSHTFTSTSTPAADNGPGSTSTVIVAASGSTTSTAAPSSTGDPSAAATKGVSVARKTVVVLVAIAGSIGLTFLIWTGIRKWKFRPSRRFEDRMQDPINWAPTQVGFDSSDPASRLESHRRNGSTGSHGSFGSSEMAHNNTVQPMQYNSYGATGAGVSRSMSGRTVGSSNGGFAHQDPQALPPLPPHDFTAAGNGHDAYDFYHNGSGSPPQMVENGLVRGGSLNRPVSMRSEDPYGGVDDSYDDHRPNLPPHHGTYNAGY